MGKKRSAEHIRAQKAGKEADAYICFFCGTVSKGNHGHHILYYSEAGPANVGNMITLCPRCHRRYHAGKLNGDIVRF